MSGGGSAALDMSLDDLIKTNKCGSNSRGRARAPPGPGPGPSRRMPSRSTFRPAPYAPKNPTWDHDLFGVGGTRSATIETEGKLYVSNLDYGVSNEDIKELFAEVGDLKRHSIHYDRSGRSKGTAEVVFMRHQDAVAALKRYNNVQLDGKPMKVEIVGTSIPAPPVPLATNDSFRPSNGSFRPSNGSFRPSNGFSRPSNGYPRSGRGTAGPRGRGARGGDRGFGGGRGGRGRGRGRDEKVSAEDLDAELEKYHKEAMKTD